MAFKVWASQKPFKSFKRARLLHAGKINSHRVGSLQPHISNFPFLLCQSHSKTHKAGQVKPNTEAPNWRKTIARGFNMSPYPTNRDYTWPLELPALTGDNEWEKETEKAVRGWEKIRRWTLSAVMELLSSGPWRHEHLQMWGSMSHQIICLN